MMLVAVLLFLVAADDAGNPAGVTAEITYRIDFGGSGLDAFSDVAKASDGTIYVVGSTESIDLPIVRAIQPELAGGANPDAFIARLNPSNGQVIFSTYFGGTGFEEAHAITVDVSGNSYIVGTTRSDDLPILRGTQDELDGTSDAFVASFSPVGTLRFATFFGGPEEEIAYDIDLDTEGNVWFVGETSGDVPTVGGTFNPAGGVDAFLAALSSTGESIVFSTPLGGPANDRGFALAISDQGRVVVTGETLSRDFPVVGGPEDAEGEPPDIFAIGFDLGTREVEFSTRFGGSAGDEGQAVDIDGDGRIYLAGISRSDDYPVELGTQETPGGSTGSDAVVTVLSPDGAEILFSTYLGGSSGDQAFDVAVLDDTMVTVVGQTFSSDFPDDVNRLADPGPGFDWAFATTFAGIDSGKPSVIFSSTIPSADRMDGVIPYEEGVVAMAGFTRTGVDGAGINDGYLSLLKLAELPAVLPDLNMAMTVREEHEDGILRVGERLTYSIEIENLGGPAVDLRVTDDYPDMGRLGLVSAFGILEDGRVSWDLATLKSGETQTFSIDLFPESVDSTFDNFAFGSDRRATSDTASVTGTVQPATIQLLGLSALSSAPETIDLYVNDSLVIDDLDPMSGRLVEIDIPRFDPKIELVDGAESGSDLPYVTVLEDLFTGSASTLAFSSSNLVVAFRADGNPALMTRRHSRLEAASPALVEVTIGNAAAGLTTLDLALSGIVVGEERGLDFGGFTDYVQMEPGVLRIEVNDPSGGSTLGSFEFDLTDRAGDAVTVVIVVTGFPGPTRLEAHAFGSDGSWIQGKPVSATSLRPPVSDPLTLRSVYPNPVSSEARVVVVTNSPRQITVRLFDILGREIVKRDLGYLPAGESAVGIPLDRLVAGQYFLSVDAGEHSATGTFIVAK